MLPYFLPLPWRTRVRSCCVSFLPFLALLLSTRSCPSASAAGVVSQPTEAALVAAMQGGGVVTFNCNGVIPITSTKKVGPGVGGDGTTSLTLDATGHNITLDGGGRVQILYATTTGIAGGNASYSLTLKHLVLVNGYTNNAGGAVYIEPHTTVNVDACTFANNQAVGSGGALVVSGYGLFTPSVTVTNSVFSGNTVVSSPGTPLGQGIATAGALYISVFNSTFTNCAFLNNQVKQGIYVGANGGAIYLGASGNTFINCTFVGNSATAGISRDAHGGAVYGDCGGAGVNGVFTNCTIANNTASGGMGGSGQGGGIFSFNPSRVVLTNTIIANNTGSTSDSNSSGTTTDGGHNICSDASCAFTSATSKNSVDPLLGPLVYTGGATPTLSLLAGSPAIDAGDDTAAPTTDQRGAPRQGSHSDIGAYERPVWQADGIAAPTPADTWTRVLWNRSDGLCNLWCVDGTSNVVQSYNYGPYLGWRATGVSANYVNNTHLLWTNVDGRTNVWEVDTRGATGRVLFSYTYGPFPGWTATQLSIGADDTVRLLWRNADGRADLWNLYMNTGSVSSSFHFGSFAGWTVSGMSAAGSGGAWLLWKRSDGLANLWKTDSAGNVAQSYNYGPFAGWDVTSVSVGGDGNARLAWNRSDGLQEVWRVNNGTGAVTASWDYGPFAGFACTGVSVGSDNNPRLLWNHVDGLLDLWSINGNGGLLSSFHYGPF